MDSFDISSDSEEALLDEIVIGNNYQQFNTKRMQYQQFNMNQQQQQPNLSSHSQYAQYTQRHSHHHHSQHPHHSQHSQHPSQHHAQHVQHHYENNHDKDYNSGATTSTALLKQQTIYNKLFQQKHQQGYLQDIDEHGMGLSQVQVQVYEDFQVLDLIQQQRQQQYGYYEGIESPIHYCDNATYSDTENSYASTQESQQHQQHLQHLQQTKLQLQIHPEPLEEREKERLEERAEPNVKHTEEQKQLPRTQEPDADTDADADTIRDKDKDQQYKHVEVEVAVGVNVQVEMDLNQQKRPQQPTICCSSSTGSNLNIMADGLEGSPNDSSDCIAVPKLTGQLETEPGNLNPNASSTSIAAASAMANEKTKARDSLSNNVSPSSQHLQTSSSSTSSSSMGASFNHQLTADMCNYKNSKSRRLEYSLKCLKYARSNPSQDSAFGSLTDNDLSIGSSSFRLSSFQSITSPIDEGVEDIIIATTTAGNETCLELATIPRNMISQDSAISSPCRESSPCHFLNVDDGMSGGSISGNSSSSGSASNIRPQHFPISLSPKILVTATTNSSNSSLASIGNNSSQHPHPHSHSHHHHHHHQQQPPQQFDPPKIIVNDQNSIYTTSPSKRSGTIEVFSQKYRVSSFEDMSPSKRPSSKDKHLKNANRLAFRSLEEERRIDNAFIPINDRTNSENRVNLQSEKYKKLTHSSFRISKTSSHTTILDSSPIASNSPGPNSINAGSIVDLQRPATAAGTSSSTTRQTLWRDSKFYRTNHIAKSNDSLLETSPNHSARLSPASLRDNQYDSSSSYGSRSQSRQSLHRGGSVNDYNNTHPNRQYALSVYLNNSEGHTSRRYCSSKSEDLGESGNDYLRVMDARKAYSERHLVTLTKLKQTAINSTGSTECCLSEDEMSFNEDNNTYPYQTSHHDYPSHSQGRQRQHYGSQQNQIPAQYLQQPAQLQAHPQQLQSQLLSTCNFYKRPHPNHFSWSACSINHLKTTNIKTTSLSTLPACQTNLRKVPSSHLFTTNSNSNSNSASPSASISASSPTPTSKSMEALKNQHFFSDSSPSKYNSNSNSLTLDHQGFYNSLPKYNGSCSPSLACTTTHSNTSTCDIVTSEDNSSADESSSHPALSAAELSKIFTSDSNSCCNEEKTPLLDSVELASISPTEPDLDKL